MVFRPFAVLALALALTPPASAGTVVEVVPELSVTGTAPGVSAAQSSIPLQLSASALVPSLNLSAPALPAALSAPVALTVAAPAALHPVQPAAAIAAQPNGAPKALITTLSAPALDVSKLGVGDASGAAEKDFNARAQLGEPSALRAGDVSAPSAEFTPVTKGHLSLVHSAKTPAIAKTNEPGLPLDLVATPESLRAMAERGESRILIQTADGRWLLAPRTGASTAYPTPEEIEASAGQDGRRFVISKAGLVEWNTTAAPGADDALRTGASAFLAKIPFLQSFVFDRAGVATRKTSWDQAVKTGLEAGEAPLNEAVLLAKTIPAFIAEEFPVVAAKLGRKVDAAYAADVLKRSNGYRMYWHSSSTYKDHPDNVGIPDGHFRPDFGIRLMVKPDWRKIPDLSANYRPLFAHEYVHWLQNEGHVSRKYGSEIAAVAVEVLRAIELIGYDQVRAGRAATVHPGVLSSFEGGREWARSGFKSDGSPYLKGGLAGAAYEAAQVTGRPGAAWEFLNLVIAGKGALEPADAWARVVGSK